MYTLSNQSLANLPNNIQKPNYDRKKLTENIIHIGVGGFHRSHQALYIHDLMQMGETNWAIFGVGIMPQDELMFKALNQQDILYTLVEQSSHKGTAAVNNAKIIGSITSYVWGYKHPELVFEKMHDTEIKLVTLTATEAGYYLDETTGTINLLDKNIQHDLKNPNNPHTIFGYLAKGLEIRFNNNIQPFTVLSCDNIQHNGQVLRAALIDYCKEYNVELALWIAQNVAFPCCMVDRITPATTNQEREMVQKDFNILDAYPVAAETFRQWIIEDNFCNDRPPLEKVGVNFTDNVSPYEAMKIGLLNGSHSCMGYLGHLVGYEYIYQVAQANEFIPYIRLFMDKEVTPLLQPVPNINFEDYKQSLMQRFSNDKIKDQVLRICMDGSGKIPKYILPTIRSQLEKQGSIRYSSLVIASWIRFLQGIDEKGNPIPIQDPQGERLHTAAKACGKNPQEFLALSDIFGDLGKNPIFIKEIEFLLGMLYDKGAKATIEFCTQSS